VKTGGSAPIPIEEILEVSSFSIEAARLAREGGGVVTSSEIELLHGQ
jgi:hypothetical protein